MRRAFISWIVLAVLCFAAASCGGHSTRPRHRSHASSSSSSAHVAGGCGGTQVYRGRAPSWTAAALSDSSGVPSWPFALSTSGSAVTILFGYPLRAGNPTDSRNKILWIMRLPRDGSRLIIHATPLGRHAPVVSVSEPADSGPGEIYPSYVNVPSGGCWHLTFRWAQHIGSINLNYTS
jgi:hypothetical protein